MIRFLLAWALASPANAADRVVVIGIDGLGGDAVRSAMPPNLKALMNRGAWTLHARGVMPTSSSPNWASMIMGAGPEQHGVTSNDWQPNRFQIAPVCRGTEAIYPTVFGALRQQRPQAKIGIFHEWDDYARLAEPSAPSKVVHGKDASATVAAALAYFRDEKPDLLFIHLDLVDHAGHTFGWRTPEYFSALAEADRYLGEVMAAARDGAAILVTADHGGRAKSHGGSTMEEIEIPWILAGPGVKHAEIKKPVNIYDTAPTIARLLGIQAPACWIARPVDEAFE